MSRKLISILALGTLPFLINFSNLWRSEISYPSVGKYDRIHRIESSNEQAIVDFIRCFTRQFDVSPLRQPNTNLVHSVLERLNVTPPRELKSSSDLCLFLEQLPESGTVTLLTNKRDLMFICVGVVHTSGCDYCRLLGSNGQIKLTPMNQVLAEPINAAWSTSLAAEERIHLTAEGVSLSLTRIWNDFGQTAVTGTGTASFDIHNDGTETLSIGEFAASCGCVSFSVSPTQIVTIPPGDSFRLAASISFSPAESLRQTVAFSIIADRSDLRRRVLLSILGSRFQSSSCSPGKIDFGVHAINGIKTKSIQRTICLTETHSDRLNVASIDVDGGLAIRTSVKRRPTPEELTTTLITCEVSPNVAENVTESREFTGNIYIHTTSEIFPLIAIPYRMDLRTDKQ